MSAHREMPNRMRQVALNLGLAAVYVAAGRLGRAVDPTGGLATAVWPPSGIALAAILLFGRRVTPGIYIGAVGAHLLKGASVPLALGMAIGNAGEAFIGGLLLRRVRNFTITLERVSSVVALIVWGATLSSMIAATVGVVCLRTGGVVPISDVPNAWRAWWIGDMVGTLLIAPLILVWYSTPRAPTDVRRRELAALVIALVIVSALTFFSKVLNVAALATPLHHADLIVAVLLWAAIRFGQRGGTTAVLFVSVVAIVATALGHGPFVRADLTEGLLLVQTFMAILSATCLLFGAAVAERRIADEDARRARLAAETANGTKSQFLSIMSHELRTPLNAISGFAELLETGVYGPMNEKQTDALKRIKQNEKDLLSLIDGILGFVNAENKPIATELTDVRVADALDQVWPLIAPEVERKHLVVARELSDHHLVVRVHEQSLEQILAGILSNAAKYTGEWGRITLGAHADGDRVRIWIRDTGVGIEKAKLEQVFEPFFQAEGGTTRRYSGVGLGLTIARDLARRMGGDVTITSEVGKGTEASLVLPSASAKAHEAGAPAATEAAKEKPAQDVAA